MIHLKLRLREFFWGRGGGYNGPRTKSGVKNNIYLVPLKEIVTEIFMKHKGIICNYLELR